MMKHELQAIKGYLSNEIDYFIRIEKADLMRE